MRLSVFFLFVMAAQVWASDSYSQSTRLTLNMKDTRVLDILGEIEEKSEFYFLFNQKLVDVERKVNIDARQRKIEDILNELFAGTNVNYLVLNRQIVLTTAQPGSEEYIRQTTTQQQGQVTGKVTDRTGAPLPGVTVVVKGTTTGTITDANGDYSLGNVPSNASLVFSFVGMRRQEIAVGNLVVINIQMVEEAVGIEEIVAIGYGTQRKVNITGSVSSVDFEDIAYSSRTMSNVSTLLSGMTSGIRVQQINGLPSDNDNATITIRGTGSLNASSSPLVLVDGQVADFNSVIPNDVANVSILKDAASAAIYGSRASNGVILITTKSGKDTNGKISFNYNSYVGRSKPSNKEDLVDYTPDYMKLINMMRVNQGQPIKFSQEYIDEWKQGSITDPISYPNTNWWDAIIKDNLVMNHHISARGGNNTINFYTGVEYFYDDGLVRNTGYDRLNFRNNLEYKVNNWLKLGNNITAMLSNAEPASIADAFQWFRATTPAVVPKHPDGRYGSGQLLTGEGGVNNMVANVENRQGETKTNQLQGKIYAILSPLKGLTITGSYFLDKRQVESWSGNVPVDRWNFQTNQIGINMTSGSTLNISNSYNRSEREIIDAYVDYILETGNHNFHALAGFNQEYFISKNFSASRSDLLSYSTPVLNAAASNPQASGTASDFAMRSFFGRLTYNFSGKYLVETNLRYDGSSRFAPNRRWGLFPSLSAGWIVSEEGFWNSLSTIINSFKLRASWGELGNNGIGNYEWQNFYQPANYARGGTSVQGLRFNAFGNPTITWETTEVINFGVDMRLLNTLTFDINYYDKHTFNILANVPIPMVNGGISAPRINSAEVLNRGIETEAKYSKNIGNVGVNLGFNFAYNKNKILKYKGDLIEPRGSTQAWTEGKPIGIFWVREVDQIVQDMAIINEMVTNGFTFHPQTPGLGDFLYKNNKDDKFINDDDRVLKGNPIPLITYGGNLGFSFAGFDLNAYFDGVGGWDRYLAGSTYSLDHLDGYQWPKEYLNAWTSDNPSSKIPKIYSGNTKNNQVSDYFLRSAAYLKVRSIQLGYNLPKYILDYVEFTQARIFVNLEGYFTFTKWPSTDPEVTVSDYDQTYPLSKTISMGLNISF